MEIFKTLLSIIDRTTRQKAGRDIGDLDSYQHLHLIEIYGTLYTRTSEYTFASLPRGVFTKIDHLQGHKISLNKFQKIENFQSMFSDHNKIKLEMTKIRELKKGPQNLEIKQQLSK